MYKGQSVLLSVYPFVQLQSVRHRTSSKACQCQQNILLSARLVATFVQQPAAQLRRDEDD